MLSRSHSATLLLLVASFQVSASAQQKAFAEEKTIAAATETGAVEKVEKVEKPEEAEPGCFSPSVKAVTDRPTIASATETTQCGVLELLSGPERVWAGHGVHQDDLSEQLQFGLTPKLDLHYGRSGFFGLGNNPGPLTGQGDTFVGARYRFNKQAHLLPSFGTFYTLKVPTGSVAAGMGTGKYDHALSLLVSKDVPRLHFDFNVTPTFAGRTDRGGYDKNTQLVLFASTPLAYRFTLVAGSFGSTKLNDDIPAYASATLGFTWQVLPRLILDVGWDEGLTSDAPRKRLAFGLSCAPANLYALFRGPRADVH